MPLRLLHVTPYYEGAWGYGGIPRVASALCRALASRGHGVTVCTTDARDGVGRLAGANGTGGVDVRVFPNVSNRLAYGRQFFTPMGLAGFLRDAAGNFDVAHIHGHHHLPGVLAGRELQRAGIPYVVTTHGVAMRLEGQRFAKFIFDKTVGRRVLPEAARVLAVSAAERGHLLDLGVRPDQLRIVPNPVDLDAVPARGSLRGRFGFDRFILYLGTLIPRKCVDVLVRALPLLSERGVGLVIAGNDLGAGDRIRAVVKRLRLESAVRFLGLVVGEERAALLADAEVVAYAGRLEVFGLVALEALLSGTPVVVANDSGCGEVIESIGGGLLVPPGEPAPLASALSQILRAPTEWREAARVASETVRVRFTATAVAEQLEAHYAELL